VTKRGRIVLASSAVLFALFAIVMAALVATLQTTFGQEQIRQLILSSLEGRVNGSIYLGRIESGLLTGVTVDSFAIRGPDDSLFISTGRVKLRYDIRDLFDRRLLIRASKVEKPYVHIKQHTDGQWNFRRIFKSQRSTPLAKQRRGLADYIILESTEVNDGTFILTLPWRPPRWARGAVRDSIIQYELSRDDIDIRRADTGFSRTWLWHDIDGVVARVRLADPDSAERVFEVEKLRVTEVDPPFRFNYLRGTVRQLGDSVWIDVPKFDLPASTGRGKGKIVWGSNLPIRYAFDIVGDSVSMRDIAWIHPSLPTTGVGRTKFRMRNNPRNLHHMEYTLTEMDVRTHRSHLTGAMTFELGADTLIVKDVALGLSPVNFDLLRVLNQGPFPYDWQGDITGTVRASGGNLARFKVEEANLTFADANVPGAVARGRAKGELNIFNPSLAEFHGLEVEAETVDLRTFQYLNKDFARLQGTVAGRVVLDSSWLDVRFRDAEIWHRHDDSPFMDSPRSRVTGSGRVTWGEEYLTYDLELQGDSIAMTTIRRSYPTIPLHGMFAGPIRVKGQSPALQVTTTLSGPGGTVTYDGLVDVSLPTYGAKGKGTFRNLDLRAFAIGADTSTKTTRAASGSVVGSVTGAVTGVIMGSITGSIMGAASRAAVRAATRAATQDTVLSVQRTTFVSTLSKRKLPQSALQGSFFVDVSGDSLATLTGSADVEIQRASRVGAAELLPSFARVRFNDGVAFVDTLSLATEQATADASGSVSLVRGERGALAYVLSFTSLIEIDRLLGRPQSAQGVGGALTVEGAITGSYDSLDVEGQIRAKNVAYKAFRIARAHGDFSIDNAFHAPAGFVKLTADTVGVRMVAFDSASASLQIDGLRRMSYRVRGVGRNGIRTDGTGDIVVSDTATIFNVSSAGLAIDSINTYLLSAPTSVVLTPRRISTDSLMLTRRNGGTIALRYFQIAGDSLRGSLHTSSLHLAVLQLLGFDITELEGTIAAQVDLHGTTREPRAIGAVRVVDGSAVFPQLGARLIRINGNISLEGDTVHVKELTAETQPDREHHGRLTLDGTIAFSQFDNPVFALRAVAKNFRAVEKRGLASLDLSTSTPLTLSGPYSAAIVQGGILVDRGSIYIPELIRKRVIDLKDPELYDVIDTTTEQDRRLLPETPSEFVKNLRLENVGVTIGDDVWLRSAEANIKLDGSLTVQGGTRAEGGEQLALLGELRATRGIYRLNVVPLVQPTFEVENGVIRFYGSANLDPTINITAIHTVRKPQQSVINQDIRIRATIGGTLPAPTLTLSSADNLPLSQSDLLSYLITGEPAFALDYTTRTYVNQLTAVVIRSAGNALSSAIPRSVFDVVELQTPGARGANNAQTQAENPTLYNLLNTRAILGKQLNNNLFLNLSTGFCAENFGNNLGVRLEYRFKRTYRLLFGLEPGSSELTCTRGTNRSVQQTPPQFGFDFFRTWRF
jgi:autotransporter translocation and assembly factor TamB